MGAPKQKWTSEEEEALRAGVAKHGTGKWKNIQKDPEFGQCLAARSNIDLKVHDSDQRESILGHMLLSKDKWRNMSVSASGQGSREKLRTPKPKIIPAPPTSTVQSPSSTPAAQDATADTVTDSSKNPPEGKAAPRYNTMIFEALATIKDPNGSDIATIVGLIEQKHGVQNLKRVVAARLKRLVAQEKLEKVDNCYKIKKDITFGTRMPTSKPRLKLPQNPTVEEAAITAAYKIADAENKSFMACEAVKEADRVAKMAEDSDSLLQLAKEIFEQCLRGEIVLMA